MTAIQRFHTNARLAEMCVYNGVAYLAGQVPENTQANAYAQTKEVLGLIDKLLAEAGQTKQNPECPNLFSQYAGLCGDESGVGRMGGSPKSAKSSHRRSQARFT